MTRPRTDQLIEALAGDASPVQPLSPPSIRALTTLVAIAVLGGLAIALMADLPGLYARHVGREAMMALEMAAMLATGVLAVTGAFFISVPGRSRRWLVAPLIPFFAWIGLSGLGCYGDLVRNGPTGWELGHSADCLIFILAVSFALGIPMAWRLSRAAPVDPLPVALLGGLGVAALAAFLLQFFHPFAVTFLDLAVHVAAIGIVVAALALVRRPALAAA